MNAGRGARGPARRRAGRPSPAPPRSARAAVAAHGGIYLVALAGITVFYALEWLAARAVPRTLVTTGHGGTGQELG